MRGGEGGRHGAPARIVRLDDIARASVRWAGIGLVAARGGSLSSRRMH